MRNYTPKIIGAFKSSIKILATSITCFVFLYTPCYANQTQAIISRRTTSMINPLWKKKIKLIVPKTFTASSGSVQAVQNTVASYDEFEAALARNMRDRKSPISIYFNPHMSETALRNWNYEFWGTSSSVADSQLFKKIPWLFWAWTSLNMTKFYDSQGLITNIDYNITYYYNSTKEKELENKLITTMNKLISKNMDMITREKTIHDWIVSHVDYDNATVAGKDDMGFTDYGAFINGLAVCEGYSTLTNRMLFMAGIPNMTVSGSGSATSSTEDHAWNLVDLDNDWYQLDVTWDDMGLYGDNTIYYKYFNLSDAQLAKDHSWDMSSYPQAFHVFDENLYKGKIEHNCSIFEPNLCTNEMDCIKINGIWDGSYCSMCSLPIIDSFSADCTFGTAALKVTFTCSAHDTEKSIVSYKWDFNTDGTYDLTTKYGHADHTYNHSGTYNASCTAINSDGKATESNTIKITVTDSPGQQQCPSEQSCLSFEALNCTSSDDCSEKSTFHVNDNFQIKLCINSQQADHTQKVDLYIGLGCPGGTLIFLTANPANPMIAWHGGAITPEMAYKTQIEQTNKCFVIYNFAVPPGFQGTYNFYALLQKAGHPLSDSPFLSNLAYKIITFGD